MADRDMTKRTTLKTMGTIGAVGVLAAGRLPENWSTRNASVLG